MSRSKEGTLPTQDNVKTRAPTEDLWQSFSAKCIEEWQKEVGRMMDRLDNKIDKATTRLSVYRSEVERLVKESPLKANVAVRNAMLKNLNTQDVLLSILELQQRALEEFACQLYNGLLELCTNNLFDVAKLLGCHVSSPAVTFDVMKLIKRTVNQRRAWITEQFELRRAKVVAFVNRLNREFKAMLQMPLRRSATGGIQRGHAENMSQALEEMNRASRANQELDLIAVATMAFGMYRTTTN